MHSVDGPGKIISSCGGVLFPKADLAKCFLSIVPQFGHHRLQMTFEEGAAVPSHAAAIRARIHDLKAKHLQIFQLRVPWYKAWDRIRCCPQDEFSRCVPWFISFVLDVVAFRRPARSSQNEPVFIVVIGRHPLQVNDVAGLVCLCHLLISDSWPDCLRKLYPFAYSLESAGTHHRIPAAPHSSCRTPVFSGPKLTVITMTSWHGWRWKLLIVSGGNSNCG